MKAGADNAALTVSITTLGCKANQYDSSAIEETLLEKGARVVPFPSRADAYVINTCTVTGRTDRESRQLIRRVRRMNPDAVVIVTGCYAQVSPGEVAGIDGVDYVVGNPDKGRISELIGAGRPFGGAVKEVGDYREGPPLTLRARASSGRTRAYLKIQEGCSRACSYCIIPMARGESKSLSLNDAEGEIDRLVEAGFKEIVLTGIHLGAYGEDSGGKGITGVAKLIERRGWKARFRLSSLDPDEVTDGLIEIMSTSRLICNHLHMPLQSGDDAILRRMRRTYTRKTFEERVTRAVKSIPGVSVGADVIAGFPGEGGPEFENTFSLLAALPVAYLHVFPYSKRRGTPAAAYTPVVPPAAAKERTARLRALDSEKRRAFTAGFLGKTLEVLIESRRDRMVGLLAGRSSNYIQCRIKGGDALRNTLSPVRMTGLLAEGMEGEAEQGSDED